MATAAAAAELIPLARELSARERERLRGALRRLLRFHRTLAAWPAGLRAPGATPIVAVYERGVLRGCALERSDRAGGEKLARAFVAATAAARGELAVELSYPRRVRWLADPLDVEVGSEGLALVRRGQPPVLLMPQVARDHGVDARGLVALLADKARVPLAELRTGARFAAWTVEAIAARMDDVEARYARIAARARASEADYAAAWLARMVDATGRVAFAIDARARVLQPDGPLWHARSAIAIEALAAHGAHPAAVARARGWLGRDLARVLRGETVAHWPAERAAVAGTLALACLAGIDVRDRLLDLVARDRWRELAGAPAWPWHAAQIAAALARATPPPLWQACVASIAQQPFAPYVVLAARAIGDAAAARQAARATATFVRRRPPHRGGATATALPETGLTAVAAHALADRDALEFVRARQLLPGGIPAALDPTLALGGFTASPIDDTLRADITGHALLALLALRRRTATRYTARPS